MLLMIWFDALGVKKFESNIFELWNLNFVLSTFLGCYSNLFISANLEGDQMIYIFILLLLLFVRVATWMC